MKKLLLLLATVITLTAKAQTSVYHPFPTDSAMWRVDWSDNNFCLMLDRVYQYYYNGDTIINLNTYHKIYKSGIVVGGCYTGTPFGYQGALREDTVSRKVYLVLPGTSNDSLLYDFTLNVGDTLHSLLLTTIFDCSDSAYTDTVIVTSIDSILVGNSYRKQWNFGNGLFCIYNPIIEGIGSIHGLIEDLGAFEQGGILICFKTDSLTFNYYPSSYGCNFIIADIQEVNETKYFELNPNPFNDELNIFIKENEQTEIILYDIASRKLLQQKFTNSVSLNTEQLAKGLYLYEVRSKNGLCKKGKVVKD